jgi:hypothetical protein
MDREFIAAKRVLGQIASRPAMGDHNRGLPAECVQGCCTDGTWQSHCADQRRSEDVKFHVCSFQSRAPNPLDTLVRVAAARNRDATFMLNLADIRLAVML